VRRAVHDDDRPAEAYRLAAGGATWSEVAAALHYSSRVVARGTVARWAARQGQPWPVGAPEPVAYQRDRPAAAYALAVAVGRRVSADQWDRIAADVGYSGGGSARNATRAWATATGAAWPPERGA
jgi:hypothetical protein